jgi:hypothetical protein
VAAIRQVEGLFSFPMSYLQEGTVVEPRGLGKLPIDRTIVQPDHADEMEHTRSVIQPAALQASC